MGNTLPHQTAGPALVVVFVGGTRLTSGKHVSPVLTRLMHKYRPYFFTVLARRPVFSILTRVAGRDVGVVPTDPVGAAMQPFHSI